MSTEAYVQGFMDKCAAYSAADRAVILAMLEEGAQQFDESGKDKKISSQGLIDMETMAAALRALKEDRDYWKSKPFNWRDKDLGLLSLPTDAPLGGHTLEGEFGPQRKLKYLSMQG